MNALATKVTNRAPGICLYGIAPPKLGTEPTRMAEIAAQQLARFATLNMDGLVVYDIQDERARNAAARPFPFLPTVDSDLYAREHLRSLAVPKIVYRSVHGTSTEDFCRWLDDIAGAPEPRFSVLVGAPSSQASADGLSLQDAYALARDRAPALLLGGIAIAERHARKHDEHQRILAKMDQGCRFFITQAIYDATSVKSLISDYALLLRAREREPVPLLLTFSPCGSAKTLEFMKWLGISFPRWLENDLRTSDDQLQKSVTLCETAFADVLEYAREKQVPLGINVESVSIRKQEIEASVELFHALRAKLHASAD